MNVALTSAQNKKGIVSFLALSFGLAWTIWIGAYLFNISLSSPTFGLLNILAAITPAISAFIVRRFITKEGFGDVGFKIKLRSLPYFVLAWILPLIIITVVAYLSNLLQLTELNFSVNEALNNGNENNAVQMSLPLFTLTLMVGALTSSIILFGEEFGWRGYLQKKLYWHSPWKSATITGIIWGIWHYPINLQGYNFPEYRLWGLLVFPLSCIFLSYIFAWFYRKTGSIWSTCLAHAGFNTIAGSLMVVLYVNKESFIFSSIVGVIGMCVLALIAFVLHLNDKKAPATILANA